MDEKKNTCPDCGGEVDHEGMTTEGCGAPEYHPEDCTTCGAYYCDGAC